MNSMPKIAFIGAGSVVFTRNLCSDILLTPALQDSTLTLMDIDPNRLAQAQELVQVIVGRRQLKARVEATTDRCEAVAGADYVITTFQQGGLEAYVLDIEIPQRYGVEQCVGDTLGPGGVFRALRTIPVLLDLCRNMDEVAPDALLLNYVNPMAANCWAIDRATGRPHVGLCHSVQGTSAVRTDLMKYFGYFVTESSGHASEYVPYFRKTARMVEEELAPRFKLEFNDWDSYGGSHWFDFGRTGGYLRHCFERLEESREVYEEMISGHKSLPTKRTHEYGSHIIEAIETNRRICINGNVPNRNLITNLPYGCCVEVPCLVDSNGIQPTAVGALPPQLAALNRTNINVQELIVEAALTGDTETIYHAVMLDPLTAAVCTLPQIRAMVDELLAAQAQWLPQFQR
ncbi:MAG: alpha-glucosidase/alpha-galactosidase [Chloroflexi bacterium]|nr:alpha-glucosidase/alpha-galactosidase [Chloroflexota bacterium]